MTRTGDLPHLAEKPPDQPEPPHMVAGRAWIAIRALYRAHAQLARREGDHLELLLRKQWYGRCGYSSFHDFVREELQFSPRTARRRVALSRLTSESLELAAALDSGRLSPCQVLALSRLRDAPDLGSWITMAHDCTVRDLEQLVSNYVSDLSSDEAHGVSPGTEQEEPGRRITFSAPVSAAVVWQHGIDMAQKVLGWDAPTYQCIEAVLEETAVELACGQVNEKSQGLSSEVAGESASPWGDLPPVEEKRSPAESPPDLKATRQQLEALRHTIEDAELEVKAVDSILQPCEDDPDLSIAALLRLRRRDRSLRLLLARLIRDADMANIFPFLGHPTATDFLVMRLKMSERSAARFMSESWTFEDSPKLAQAFSTGRIGLGQAYLVNRVAVSSTQAAFIHRAETVTHLQFDREVRFLERLRDFVPSVAQQFHGPLPLPDLPGALIQRLRDLGWTEVRIEECVGGFEPGGDPAVDPLLMSRLEGLLELVALAFEEHDMRVAGALPTLATPGDSTASLPMLATPADPPGQLPTLATPFGHRATDLTHLVAGELNSLPMLATLEHRDPLPSRTTISFWAPESLITRWNTTLDQVRAQHGPLPVWARALFLLRRAVEEWQRVDPARRPAEWSVFERDEWRCRAPGCSSRRRLEAHHIIFRSQNGSDDPENLVSLCHAHHHHGIHEGYLQVKGAAPSSLRWRLGGRNRRDGTPRPVRRFHGSQIVARARP